MSNEKKEITQRKSNKSVKTAVLLFGAVLLTTSLLGGTLAKYVGTLGTASDTARVAKWEVEAGTNTFSLFKKEYDGSLGASNNSVVSSDDNNVFAPGTSGAATIDPNIDLGTVDSETAYKIVMRIDQALTGYTDNFAEVIQSSTSLDKYPYYPLQFQVTSYGGTPGDLYNGYATPRPDGDVQLDELIRALATLETDPIYPNDDSSTVTNKLNKLRVTINWRWEFERQDLVDAAIAAAKAGGATDDEAAEIGAAQAKNVDLWDTTLGERSAAALLTPTTDDDLNFNISLSGTAVQVD